MVVFMEDTYNVVIMRGIWWLLWRKVGAYYNGNMAHIIKGIWCLLLRKYNVCSGSNMRVWVVKYHLRCDMYCDDRSLQIMSSIAVNIIVLSMQTVTTITYSLHNNNHISFIITTIFPSWQLQYFLHNTYHIPFMV